MRILYPIDGHVRLINPGSDLPADEAARKDVPEGVPYILVPDDDLPAMSLFGAWRADFSEPDGFGIGEEAWFAEQAEIEAERSAQEAAQVAGDEAQRQAAEALRQETEAAQRLSEESAAAENSVRQAEFDAALAAEIERIELARAEETNS